MSNVKSGKEDNAVPTSRVTDDTVIAEIVSRTISPEQVVRRIKTENSGCVATYVGLIRDNSHGKAVLSVEYRDDSGKAREGLAAIAKEIADKFPVNKVGLFHRVGVLKVGDINFVAAIAASHRQEGFAACAYAVDRFKELLPTKKIETCKD